MRRTDDNRRAYRIPDTTREQVRLQRLTGALVVELARRFKLGTGSISRICKGIQRKKKVMDVPVQAVKYGHRCQCGCNNVTAAHPSGECMNCYIARQVRLGIMERVG